MFKVLLFHLICYASCVALLKDLGHAHMKDHAECVLESENLAILLTQPPRIMHVKLQAPDQVGCQRGFREFWNLGQRPDHRDGGERTGPRA